MAKGPIKIPDRSQITDDTPLRLAVAAVVAFPDGSMTASGLRRERDAGRLVTEMVAGREFTTLGYIARMRELCRRKVEPASHARSGFRSNVFDKQEASGAQAALMATIDSLRAENAAERKAEKAALKKKREAARAGYATSKGGRCRGITGATRS